MRLVKERKKKTKKQDEFDTVARLELALLEEINANPGVTAKELVRLSGKTLQWTQYRLRQLAAAECCFCEDGGWYLLPVGAVEVTECDP